MSLFVNKKNLNTVVLESKYMINYALPIIFCQAGFMSLGMVDAAMLGNLGVEELSASAIARSIFWPFVVFVIGVLFSVDILASHTLGAKRKNELAKIFVAGIQLGLVLSFLLIILILTSVNYLNLFVENTVVLQYTKIYLTYICISLPCLILTAVIQRFCLSQGFRSLFVIIIIVSNLMNYFFNKALIFGEYGFNSYGILGAAIATNCSRILIFIMNVIVVYYVINKEEHLRIKIKDFFILQKNTIKKMLKIGIPSGGQQIFEVALFSLLTLLAARLTTNQIATHHILIMLLSFSYTLPLGLANAVSFRVGYLIGEGDFEKAKLSGVISVILGLFLMIIACIILYIYSDEIFSLFTKESVVINLANKLLWVVIFCKVFDALQGTTIGVLRGSGNSQLAFYACAIGYYPIGLLLAVVLCFIFKLELLGLWIGLAAGLFSVAYIVLISMINYNPQLILLETKNQ